MTTASAAAWRALNRRAPTHQDGALMILRYYCA